MHCLLFITVISGGGAERVMCQLANQLCISNTVTLVVSDKTKNEYHIDKNVNLVYLNEKRKKKNFFHQVIQLRTIIKKEQPDICLSFLPEPNFKALLASVGTKTKNIISIRNDPNEEYKSNLYKILARLLYRTADGIVFQTNDAKAWFSSGIQEKSSIIMNQVDDKFFKTEHLNDFSYVATGRLTKQKNYPLMIRAFSKMLKLYPNEILKIYGEGECFEELQGLIHELNAENNIFLMGRSNDIPAVLSEAKVFLLSSDYEGMPNGLLEALAVGVPCLSTNCPCGGPKMVIKDRTNGMLVPVKDEQSFYERLLELQESVELRNQIGRAAKQNAKNFASETVFKSWYAYIHNVLNNK